ncbi:MAG: sugar phosphate nucleotidyltransferase, partial [Pirellulaceae bacterium]
VVVAGDSPMMQADSVRKILQEARSTGAACVLGTLKHPNPHGLGRIVRDSAGNFERIVEEKDATPEERTINEVNMSTYVFDAAELLKGLDQLTDTNQQKEYYITDLPAIMLAKGLTVRALPVLQPIEALSVNTVEHLAEVERELQRMERK